jgi:hypothetical protein
MKSVNLSLKLAVLAVAAASASGCGMGKKLVKNLEFAAGQENGHLVAGFDANVDLGLGSLPEAKLPIYNPQRPAQFLGYVETHSDGALSVRVDVTEAAKVQVSDGSLLPNGREIPITLPAGVVPVAIPVINSNSKVYVAVGSQNILAGVALTVVADTSTGNSDWLRILRGLPSNIFFPFNVAADVKGTAGLFTGDKVGVGVFAVKTMSKPEKALAFAAAQAGNPLAAIRGKTPAGAEDEFFGVKTQYPVGTKALKIQKALKKVRETALD